MPAASGRRTVAAATRRRDASSRPAAAERDPGPSGSAASPSTRTNPRAFLATLLQLSLLSVAVRTLRLEEAFGLVAILPVVLVGFCVHAWLPHALRLPFFLTLSLCAFVVVLGPGPAALVVAIAAALFGLCHLPVPFGLRALLLVAAAAVLAVLRAGWIETSWAATVLPVVAAMFMFRAIVYLYDLWTGDRPTSIWMRLSYFFLLPNVCFLLFPVVDYRTLQRTYCAEPLERIHARGTRLILRGVLHLLLYRVVYTYLTPSFGEILDLYGVTLFVLSSYLLYLRISGHFHLIVGLLHLFGFGLPPTNRRYLLASSFADCWRRTNVYWTEFMKKVVYYPAFVRLRGPGRGSARRMLLGIVGATVLTFAATWWLHAYQWFWLHGSMPLATDGLFWGVAGSLALASLVLESRREPPRSGAAPSWNDALRRSVRTLGVFLAICATWSLWCSSSLEQWLAILARAANAPPEQVLTLALGATLLVVAGTLAQRVRWPVPGEQVRLAATLAGAACVALLGQARFQDALGPTVAGAVRPITVGFLNQRDRERVIDGYYERLVDRAAFGSPLADGRRATPDAPEAFTESALHAVADGPLLWELLPSREVEYLGAVVATNRWGMRDRDYARDKPPGTFRIAILGTCYEMGAGVANEHVWEALTEERLEQEVTPRTGLDYELLNFSVPGYNVVDLVTVVRDKVAPFAPDVVVVTNHLRSAEEHLLYVATGGTATAIDIDTFFESDAVRRSWPEGLAEALAPARHDPDVDWEARVDDWAFARIAATCAEIGSLPVFLSLPYLEDTQVGGAADAARRTAVQARLASAQGFLRLDIGAAFAGHDFDELAITTSRCCPNEGGHRLLGDAFFEALCATPRALGAP